MLKRGARLMARAKTPNYVPSMADAAVEAKTGKDWAAWFETLDRAKATELGHKAIATLLQTKHGVPDWWCQMLTVEYERARGLRAKHQKADGFAVSVSKTLPASVASVYTATADTARRNTWFPKGTFELSSQTADKYVNGAWNETARLNIGFYSKGVGKAQIAIQVNKLGDESQVAVEREQWKAALTKLERLLAPSVEQPAQHGKTKRAKSSPSGQ